MAIRIKDLGFYTSSPSFYNLAKSVNQAKRMGVSTAFLCHSHKDKHLVENLTHYFHDKGWNVYIDWMDEELPPTPDEVTANKIKLKIQECELFLFLATRNSIASRWCPWEIGYADAVKSNSKVVIIPTEDNDGRWYGNEYLNLYQRLDDRSGFLEVFSPFSTFSKSVRSL
jgi:hypothetical protein